MSELKSDGEWFLSDFFQNLPCCPGWSLGDLLTLDRVFAGIQRQVSRQKGYSDRLACVSARDDRAFAPALSYGRKKQVEPIWHRKWIMHDQLGFVLRHE